MEVKVDNSDWDRVNLYAEVATDSAVVYSIEDLSSSRHHLRIRVSGEKQTSSRGYGINFSKIEYSRYNNITISNEEVFPTLLWGSLMSGGSR